MNKDTLQTALVLLAEAHAQARVEGRQIGVIGVDPVGATEPYFSAAQVLAAVETAQALERERMWLHAHAVRLCNGYATHDHKWDQDAADRDATQAEKHKAKVLKLLEPYGVSPSIGGDPRGSVMSIKTPQTARSNGWDNGRWHV